jgi:excisionase family DNA binding protein
MQTTNIPPDQRAAFTVEEAGTYIGLKRSTIYQFVREGRLQDVKIAGRRVILKTDLDQILRDSTRPREAQK